MKKCIALFMTLVVMFTVCIQISADETGKDIVILFTNDVHCGVDDKIGYAGLAGYKQDMIAAGNYVALVDAGDAIQGAAIGTLSKGSYIIDIMNKVGYDAAVPGNHEFDYGMSRFLELAGMADFDYISSNFVNLTNNSNVFNSYKMMTFGDKKVAFVGISTPESFTKSNPTYFQNEKGEYIYSFCSGSNGAELYNAVQKAVDAAKNEGADYVVAVGHLGIDSQSSPWMSTEVIANTTGIDAFLDGHSHSTIASRTVKNKAGKDVLLSSTGTKLEAIGKLVISDNGVSTELITDYTKKDETVSSYIKDIQAQYSSMLNTVVATSNVNLVVNDPKTGNRIVRKSETNLGDLCADAYRTMLGADIAFVNGGGIRAQIPAGSITYNNIISVHPYGNMACMVEATGQEILDALEMASRETPNENGGFLQVSGLTYEIDISVPSSVIVDDKKMFVSVNGKYRVKNVKVGGQPLDLNKTYTLASHNYMLKSGGDGINMFTDNKILKDEILIDNQVLISYITEKLGRVVGNEYSNPYGQGRIVLVTADQSNPVTAKSDNPKTGNSNNIAFISVISLVGSLAVIMLLVCKRTKKNG